MAKMVSFDAFVATSESLDRGPGLPPLFSYTVINIKLDDSEGLEHS